MHYSALLKILSRFTFVFFLCVSGPLYVSGCAAQVDEGGEAAAEAIDESSDELTTPNAIDDVDRADNAANASNSFDKSNKQDKKTTLVFTGTSAFPGRRSYPVPQPPGSTNYKSALNNALTKARAGLAVFVREKNVTCRASYNTATDVSHWVSLVEVNGVVKREFHGIRVTLRAVCE
jgi:hypothetical protein